MKKNILIVLLLATICVDSNAFTQQEFIDYIGNKGYYTGMSHGYIFYPNGTGLYQGAPMGLYGDLMGLFGGGNLSLSYQGAEAECYYSCDIVITWKIANGKLIINYKKLLDTPSAKIVGWPAYFSPTQSQVNGIESQLRKRLATDKAKIGKSETFLFKEDEEPTCFYPANLSGLAAATNSCCGSSLDNSSSQTSYTPKEPVVVKASYPDGDYGIKNYISNKLTYPNHIRKNGYSKTASYTLSIASDGSVTNAWTNDNIDSKLANSTIQLLKNLPKRFTPETRDGQKTESEYSITISYYIDPALEFDVKAVNFTYDGGEKRIKVTSSQNWKITPIESSNFKFKKEGKYIVVTCEERNKFDYNNITEKLIVSTSDNAISYEIKVSQEGAPKPYIRPSQTTVNLPRKKKDARAVVIVDSNRDWKIIHHHPESNINAEKADERVIITTKKTGKKEGEDATITLESLDNDCQTNILVHQYSRKEEKAQGNHSSSGLGLWYNYYENYGSFELGLLSVQAGAGCTLPLFVDVAGERTLVTQPYFPMNFELGTLRFHFIELSLLNLRLDLSLDGLDGIAWEPQVRGLIPVSERWALMPYVGPVWQIDRQQIENSVWSASGGLIARVRYGHATHTDLSIGYRGGPYGGLAFSVSIGWSLGW